MLVVGVKNLKEIVDLDLFKFKCVCVPKAAPSKKVTAQC